MEQRERKQERKKEDSTKINRNQTKANTNCLK
jgi:hypothetical protein